MKTITLYHVLVWMADADRYECRSEHCSFKKTELELEAAGYEPRHTGTIYVKGDDFDGKA